MSKVDTPLYDALVKSQGTDDLLSFCTDRALSWKNPRNVKLLESGTYRASIEKYRKR